MIFFILGLNRLSAFEPAVPVEGSPRPDNRLSLGGFKGQIDNQRGLLDKNDLGIIRGYANEVSKFPYNPYFNLYTAHVSKNE